MSHIFSLGKILLCGFQLLLQPNYDWNLIETDTKIQINSNTTIESQEIRESWPLPTNPLSKLPNAPLSLCIFVYNANSL